jgi:hypothetical protein
LAPIKEALLTVASSHVLFFSVRDQYLRRLCAIAADGQISLQDSQWLTSERENINAILTISATADIQRVQDILSPSPLARDV